MAYEFKYIDCNICGSKNRLDLGERIPRAHSIEKHLIAHIVKCKSCGLIYPYPMPFADGEQVIENYSRPETYFPTEISEERFKFYESILNRINGLVQNKGALLDVGCGRGELLYAAKRDGWQVCGVDISPNFAKYAEERFGITVKVGEVKNLNFKPESFDAITLISVLDHTYDPRGLILELSRILKKGGVIFIEVMNNESLLYKLGNLYYRLQGKNITTGLSPTFPSFQIYGFSLKSISHLLNISGVKIQKIWPRGGISRTEKVAINNFRERALRSARAACLVFADLLNQGQVLEVYAKKG